MQETFKMDKEEIMAILGEIIVKTVNHYSGQVNIGRSKVMYTSEIKKAWMIKDNTLQWHMKKANKKIMKTKFQYKEDYFETQRELREQI